MSVDRSSWPWPVRMGLWKVPTRGAAWGYFILAMALALGFVAYGFVKPRFYAGGVFVLAALWYYLAIRWVDAHGEWS